MFGKNYVGQLINRSAENEADRRRFLKSASAAGLGVVGAGLLAGMPAAGAAEKEVAGDSISNSAILNALLTLLNERKFTSGGQILRSPLISVFAASNEVPGDETLNAIFDRFLLHGVGRKARYRGKRRIVRKPRRASWR